MKCFTRYPELSVLFWFARFLHFYTEIEVSCDTRLSGTCPPLSQGQRWHCTHSYWAAPFGNGRPAYDATLFLAAASAFLIELILKAETSRFQISSGALDLRHLGFSTPPQSSHEAGTYVVSRHRSCTDFGVVLNIITRITICQQYVIKMCHNQYK